MNNVSVMPKVEEMNRQNAQKVQELLRENARLWADLNSERLRNAALETENTNLSLMGGRSQEYLADWRSYQGGRH